MINGTKLLNVCQMSRGKRDGILKNEKERVVVKVGAMHLKGVWFVLLPFSSPLLGWSVAYHGRSYLVRISFARARQLADQNSITELLFPLFEDNIQSFLYHPDNYARTAAVVAAANERHQVRPIRDLPRQRFTPSPTGAPPPSTWQPTASGLPVPASDEVPSYPSQQQTPLTSPDSTATHFLRVASAPTNGNGHHMHVIDRRHSLPAFYAADLSSHQYASAPQYQQQQQHHHLPIPAVGGAYATHSGTMQSYTDGGDSYHQNHHHRPQPLQLAPDNHQSGQAFFPTPPLSAPPFQSNKRPFDEYDDAGSSGGDHRSQGGSSHHSLDHSNAGSPILARGGFAPLTPIQGGQLPSPSQVAHRQQQLASPVTAGKRSRMNSSASDGGSIPNIDAPVPGKVRLAEGLGLMIGC
jgi:hypothetical protein